MLVEGSATETETSKDSASSTQDAGKENGQAVTLPEHLVGEIEESLYAKLPAEAREALSATIKGLKGNVTRKLQDVAELRRVKEALEADPDKAKFLRKAMAEYDAQKEGLRVSADGASAARSRLDALLEDIEEPKQRKAVKEFVESLDERYDSQLKAQKKELEEVKQLVGTLKSGSQSVRAEGLSKEIAELPPAMKTLATKYREEILRMGTAPSGSRLSLEKLIQLSSEGSEYRKALLASPEQAQAEVERARQTATARPSGAVASVDTLLTKEDVTKSRDKRFGDRINIGSVVTKLLKDIKRGG